MTMAVAPCVVFVAVSITIISGMQVIPERGSMVFVNDKYVASNATFYIKRFSRRGNYYMNLEGTTKHEWANNISTHFLFYEYLHNEYKRSFVELHFKLCDMIKSDPYIGAAVAAAGVVCPLPSGPHKLNNMSIPVTNFPNVFPFERCKVDVKVLQLPTEELMFNLEGMQVIPERGSLIYVNDKYASNATFYIKRYSRRGNYYMNLEGTTKHVWANNISAHFLFYEYLHNEYKRSFVELHFKMCDLIKSEPYIGGAVAAAGVSCPVPAGPHKMNNISIPATNFPNVFPFERCKVDVKVRQLPTEELMFNLEVFVTIKQTRF